MSERYVIKAKLGEGGAGAVYRAWDTELNRTVAIKRLLTGVGEDEAEKMRKDLLREASLLSAVQHPNICRVFEFGVDEDGGFVVMEFANGEDLEEAARRKVSPEEFCGIAEQTLEGVNAAHSRNILHRDLKPSNVMINWLPNAVFQVKVLDFGLAKFSLRPQQQTIDQVSRTAKGSVYFMAPEQFEHLPLDARTDLYSLGCLFYYLLTNRHPFEGRTMPDIMTNHLEHRIAVPLEVLRPDLPPKLVQWIGWLMNRQPDDRPTGTIDALSVLHKVKTTLGATEPRPEAVEEAVEEVVEEVVEEAAEEVVESPPEPMVIPIEPAGGRAPSGPVPVVRKSTRAPLAPTAAAADRGPVAWSPPVRKKSAGMPVPAMAVGVLVIVIGVLFGIHSCQQRAGTAGGGAPGVTNQPRTVVPPVAPQPPQSGLLIWLDAGSGVRMHGGLVPAKADQLIDHWDDRATALGGNNAAVYHDVTKSQVPEDSFPKLRFLTDEGGLRGRHAVLTFNGVKNKLVIGRGTDAATGAPIKGVLPADQLTCFAVARVAKAGVIGRLISAKMGGEVNAWGISYGKEEQWNSGIHLPGGAINHVTLGDRPNEFRLLTLWWSKAAGEYRFHMIKPNGAVLSAAPLRNCVHHGPIEEIRIGSHSAGSSDFFPGDLAEILIYNRALSDADVEAAEEYLAAKYFR